MLRSSGCKDEVLHDLKCRGLPSELSCNRPEVVGSYEKDRRTYEFKLLRISEAAEDSS